MSYNINGVKYFIYNTTLNKKDYLILPEDIRRLIWNYAHDYLCIYCYVCQKILLKLEINIFKNLETENFSIINGITKCSTC